MYGNYRRKKALQPVFISLTNYIKAVPMEKGYKDKILLFSQDLWNYVKKYGLVENADDYWNSVIEDADKLYKKYKDIDGLNVIKNILLTVVNILSAEHHFKINKECKK
jgi:hypothetical protein